MIGCQVLLVLVGFIFGIPYCIYGNSHLGLRVRLRDLGYLGIRVAGSGFRTHGYKWLSQSPRAIAKEGCAAGYVLPCICSRH